MDISDSTSKYCDREGGVGKSACPDRKDSSKDYETQTWRQVEEIFEASSLMGDGDGIAEKIRLDISEADISQMINGIAMSIKFDDVLDELRHLFVKTRENNVPVFGSNQAPIKEVAEPNCATEKNNNSQQTTDRLHGFSAETTKKSCINGGNKVSLQNTKTFRHVADTIDRDNTELRAYLSEATQNTAEKQKLKLHKELVQDLYTDDTSSEKQITIVLEDVSKENINNSHKELKTALSEAAETTVKENSLKLREELAKDIYADIFNDSNELLGYITDSFYKAVLGYGRGVVKRLEVGFHKIVQKFGDELARELVNWHEDGLVEDIDELKVEVEEEIRKFTKDSELKLISVCEKEINEYGFYLGTVLSDCVKRVQVCERSTIIKVFNTNNENYLGSDEVQNKLSAVERNTEHRNTEERNDKYRNTEEKNDKYKKHPFKKMWHNIKKVFCFRGAESSLE